MRIVIFGNSGSGKSTEALATSKRLHLPVLDLATIVWEPTRVASSRSPELIHAQLQKFCTTHDSWIVEGCYGDLIKEVLKWKPELVFMNPGEQACISNCRKRPWERQKFASKAEQDNKLEFLIRWISDYYRREDEISLVYHRAIFDGYAGPKREIDAKQSG